MRFLVRSLLDHNHGIYHDRWIYPEDLDADQMQEQISRLLEKSPTARRLGGKAEDWAIHDYEGFEPIELGEYESMEKIESVVSLLNDWPAEVIAHYLGEGNDVDDLDDLIRSNYRGEHKGSDEEDAVATYLYEDLEAREDIPKDIRDSHLGAIAASMAHDQVEGGSTFTIYAGNSMYHVLECNS